MAGVCRLCGRLRQSVVAVGWRSRYPVSPSSSAQVLMTMMYEVGGILFVDICIIFSLAVAGSGCGLGGGSRQGRRGRGG